MLLEYWSSGVMGGYPPIRPPGSGYTGIHYSIIPLLHHYSITPLLQYSSTSLFLLKYPFNAYTVDMPCGSGVISL